MAQREADGAQPQRRIGLVGAGSDGQLVAAQVQGPAGDGAPLPPIEDAAVSAVMLLLGRQLLAVEVEELRPVQADALAAVRDDARHLLGKLDVRKAENAASVARLRGQVPIL